MPEFPITAGIHIDQNILLGTICLVIINISAL